MAVRALVIAIENYPDVQGGGLANSLAGTLQAGLDFRAWLLDKWRAEARPQGETQLTFCSEPVQPGGSGATSRDIRKALLKLRDEGQSATEELYFFFSGHGFSFADNVHNRADFLVASNFETAALSPECFLNLDEIILWLRIHLGPGRHYYFVDACRNTLPGTQVMPGGLQLAIDAQASGEASSYVLQSTVRGATAAADSAFQGALLDGLRGKGRAKVWKSQVNDKMYVRYDSLRSYLVRALAKKQRIAHKSDGTDDETDAVLATLSPVPNVTCTIKIGNAQAPVEGIVAYKRGRSDAEKQQAFTSQPVVLTLEPDDYTMSLQLKDAAVDPAIPVSVDLYDDDTVLFERVTGVTPESTLESMPGAQEAISDAGIDVVVPSNATFKLDNLNTGTETLLNASTRLRLPTGRYFATLRNRDGRVLKRQEIELESGKDVSLNLAEWRHSAPHVAIASKLPERDGGVDFSESLGGAVTDPNLDLWLALLGGGRILGPRGDYSKLARFPLHDFANEPANASPIYLLAGFEKPDTALQTGLSQAAEVAWVDAAQPPDMPGIRETYFAAPPGSQLVSFRIAGQPPYTIASLASPNRGMLITLTLDDEGYPRVSQYLLPLGHLLHELPVAVRNRIERRNQLNDVRFLAQASRAFRRRRDLLTAVPASQLTDLLSAKWLDPIASSLAAYELLRRGKKNEMSEVVTNMKRFFRDVPDTAALAKLSGKRVSRPTGVPLFFDGLRAFPDYADWLPLPAGHLDFASPWTAWRAAVKA